MIGDERLSIVSYVGKIKGRHLVVESKVFRQHNILDQLWVAAVRQVRSKYIGKGLWLSNKGGTRRRHSRENPRHDEMC
jgi:hypothetical protein